MIKINRTIEYALMALTYIGQRNYADLVSAKEIAESLDIPFDTTARVLQLMAQAEILKVEHGASGGYTLIKQVKNITLGDLIESIEGPLALVKCLNKERSCDISSHCNIISPVTVINNKLNSFYHSLSLEEILQETTPKPVLACSEVENG